MSRILAVLCLTLMATSCRQVLDIRDGELIEQGAGASDATSEDCTNGRDDDGNGDVDCADAACGDHRCLPTVPAGWEGPVAFYMGSEEPSCVAAWPTEAFVGGTNPTATPPTCDCSCGEVSGAVCFIGGNLQMFPELMCMGMDDATPVFSDGECFPVAAGLTRSFLSPAPPPAEAPAPRT